MCVFLTPLSQIWHCEHQNQEREVRKKISLWPLDLQPIHKESILNVRHNKGSLCIVASHPGLFIPG